MSALPQANWYDDFADTIADICQDNFDFIEAHLSDAMHERVRHVTEEDGNIYVDSLLSIGACLYLKYALIIGQSAKLISKSTAKKHLTRYQGLSDSAISDRINAIQPKQNIDFETEHAEVIDYAGAETARSFFDCRYRDSLLDSEFEVFTNMVQTLLGVHSAYQIIQNNPDFKNMGYSSLCYFDSAKELLELKIAAEEDPNNQPPVEAINHAFWLPINYFAKNNVEIVKPFIDHNDKLDCQVYEWAKDIYQSPNALS